MARWVPLCSSRDLPTPGCAGRFELNLADGRGRSSRARPFTVAVVRSKDGDIVAVEDALPPLGQSLSGAHVQIDGRVLRATCLALGSKFDLRTGDLIGPWCPGPHASLRTAAASGTTTLWRLLTAAVCLWLLSALACCYRWCAKRRPGRLRLLRSSLNENGTVFVELPAGSHKRPCWPSGALRVLLRPVPVPSRLVPGSDLEVEVKEVAKQKSAGLREFRVAVLDKNLKMRPLGRARALLERCLLLRPRGANGEAGGAQRGLEVGWAFLRLPESEPTEQRARMAALVRETLGRPDLRHDDVKVAVWVSQYVEPCARGMGVDRTLLAKMLDLAHVHGYSHLLFVVDQRSTELHALLKAHYQSQGCVEIPTNNALGIERGMLRDVRTAVEGPMSDAFSLQRSAGFASLEASLASGQGRALAHSAFALVHGYVAVPLLIEFVRFIFPKLSALGPLALAELGQACGAHAGVLAVVLRMARILGLVSADSTGRFAIVRSVELDVLLDLFSTTSNLADRLLQLYAQESPFPAVSEAAQECLAVWAHCRPQWERRCGLSICTLLDGAVVTPVLTSLVYNHRWTETGLDKGADGLARIECPGMREDMVPILDSMLKVLEVGACSRSPSGGVVQTTPSGALALQRTFTFFVGVSYAPMLARAHHILFEDASWGFSGSGQALSEKELHVERTLNVVGSGAQHKTFFNDLAEMLAPSFSSPDLSSQPAYVADTGCGDGKLLLQIYDYVRERTPRGKMLEAHPLTLIAVDASGESLRAAAANLESHGVPHKVLQGDIGQPGALKDSFIAAGVEPSSVLHVRSFLDHDRPFLAPMHIPEVESAKRKFICQQFDDFVYLDKTGSLIPGVDVYQSLVEHFHRWGALLEGSHGLCVLEVLGLDVATTQRHIADSVSFHFDILSSLSRQYLAPPAAFCMALAEAGLFSGQDFRNLRTYPEASTTSFCRVMCQHLTKHSHCVRLAESRDLDALCALEAAALATTPHLQVGRSTISKRMHCCPCGVFVAERAGQLLAALYTARIASESAAAAEVSSSSHGPVVQLLSLHASPAEAGIGSTLRDFVLLLARVDPSVESVVGITRCEGLKDMPGVTLEEYVRRQEAGSVSDKILSFHMSHGAEIVKVMPGVRPNDVESQGGGVLIRYELRGGAAHAAEGAPAGLADIQAFIDGVLAELGLLDGDALGASSSALSFAEMGLDSLDLSRVRDRLSAHFGVTLAPTVVFDCPDSAALARRVREGFAASNGSRSRGHMGRRDTSDGHIPAGSHVEVITDVLQHMGFNPAEGSGFAALGLDSLDLARLRDQLSERLGLPIPAAMFHDHPGIAELAAALETLSSSAKQSPPQD